MSDKLFTAHFKVIFLQQLWPALFSSSSITPFEPPTNPYYKFTEIWSLYPWAYWICKIAGQPNISPGPLSAAVVSSSEIGCAWGTIEWNLPRTRGNCWIKHEMRSAVYLFIQKKIYIYLNFIIIINAVCHFYAQRSLHIIQYAILVYNL